MNDLRFVIEAQRNLVQLFSKTLVGDLKLMNRNSCKGVLQNGKHLTRVSRERTNLSMRHVLSEKFDFEDRTSNFFKQTKVSMFI